MALKTKKNDTGPVKIRLLRGTIVNGEPVEKGKTVEVSSRDARILIGAGKAEALKSGAKETAAK